MHSPFWIVAEAWPFGFGDAGAAVARGPDAGNFAVRFIQGEIGF